VKHSLLQAKLKLEVLFAEKVYTNQSARTYGRLCQAPIASRRHLKIYGLVGKNYREEEGSA